MTFTKWMITASLTLLLASLACSSNETTPDPVPVDAGSDAKAKKDGGSVDAPVDGAPLDAAVDVSG